MSRNFVILYTAREGSSAIVNELSHQPEIHVPVFEILDRYAFVKHHDPAHIYDYLTKVFAEGRYDDDHRAGLKFLSRKSDDEVAGQVSSIGFKWRPHGDPDRVARIFSDHDVSVFTLFRRDFFELTASLYFSRYASKYHDFVIAGHSQFRFSRLSDDQKEAYRERLEQATVPFRYDRFANIALRRLYHARRLRRLATRWSRAGRPVHVLNYEDYLDDPPRVIDRVMSRIGVSRPYAPPPGARFEKASRVAAVDRVEGLQARRDGPALRALETLYHGEINRIEALCDKGDAAGALA